MRVLAIAPLLLLAASALGGDKVTLTRSYKPSDTDKYVVTATVSQEDIKIGADVTIKVKKTDDKGNADVQLTMTRISIARGTDEITSEPAEPMDLKLDKAGLPDKIEAKDQTVPYAICVIMSIVPGSEVETGSPFKIDWKSANGGTIKGAGTLVGVKTLNGVQVAELKYDVKVDPQGEHEEGHVKFTSLFEIATGKLLKGEGTLELEGSEGKLLVTKEGWKN